jgi:thioredoxin 2
MSTTAHQIVCPHCGSVNRIPADRSPAKAKCGRCHEALFTGRSFPATTAGFGRQIERNDIPVVVDFWADWCQPCHRMAPLFERVAAEFEPEARFLKLNTESEPEIAARYSIRSIPTLMVFKNGRIVGQQAGVGSEQALRAWLRQYLAPPARAG